MSKRKDIDKLLFGTGLFGESDAPTKSGTLVERFMVPPFSVLSAREGWWQNRKRAWVDLGIKSELGRGDDLTWAPEQIRNIDHYAKKRAEEARLLSEQAWKKPVPIVSLEPILNGNDKEKAPTSKGVATEVATISSVPVISPRSIKTTAPEAATPARLAPLPPAPVSAPVKRRVVSSAPTVAANPRAVRRFADGQSFALPQSNWEAPKEFPSLIGCKRISFDVETRDEELETKGPGARRSNCYMIGFSICADDRRWYFPIRHEGGGNLEPSRVLDWACSELNNFEGELVGANLLYDLDFAANEGITFNKVNVYHDIQIIEPLIDEWKRSYSLDNLALQYLGTGKDQLLLKAAAMSQGWKSESEIKRNLWRLPAAYVGAYAEADADLPLKILEQQLPKLEADGLHTVYEVERKLLPILLAMRRRGIRIDLAKAEEVRTRLIGERDKWLKQLKRIAGPSAELMAPESFVAALQRRGFNPPLTAKTQKPSVTADWLKSHANDELCKTIIEGRAVNTTINTFIDGHILGNQVNGRIHCQFHQLKSDDDGTISGRLSSSSPNLQNIPHRDKIIGPLVRGLFLPDEGDDIESQDQSQMEYRCLAHFAVGPGSDECRASYANDPNTDYHRMVAVMMGVDPKDETIRVRVKGINFGSVYGAGASKLGFLLNCSQEEAMEFAKVYNTKLPFVKSTFNAAKIWADKQGYVTTILGRKERFPFWESKGSYGQRDKALPFDLAKQQYGENIQRAWTYTALNKKLQGSNADYTKKAIVDCWEAGINRVLGPILLTVHDDIVLSVPRTVEGNEAAAEAKRITETCIQLKVPVIVKAKRGSNWGEC